MSRYGNISFYRDREEYATPSSEKEPAWAKDYEAALDKYSVKSRQEDQSLFNQINQILNNKHHKYSTVEEAVQDMKTRTGLAEFLERNKQASDENDNQVTIKTNPDLKTFIDNYIEQHPGTSVEAVVQAAIKYPNLIKESGLDDLGEDVRRYINEKIAEVAPFDANEENRQLGKLNLEVDNNLTVENNPLNILNQKSII